MIEHSETVTFSDVCQFPASTSAQYDYRKVLVEADDGLQNKQKDSVRQWHTSVLADYTVGDIVPDSDLILNDRLYEQQREAHLLSHAAKTHNRNSSPRTLPEACGITVHVAADTRMTMTAQAEVARVDIPDKDFTADALQNLRTLRPFADKPHLLASFADRLRQCGLDIQLPDECDETPHNEINPEVLAESLLDQLSPQRLPDARLVTTLVEYGRVATANAAINRSAVPRYLGQLTRQYSRTFDHSDQAYRLMRRRLGLCRVETVDFLQECARPEEAVASTQKEATAQFSLTQAVISFNAMEVAALPPRSHVAYHEGIHATGSITLAVEDDAGQPRLKLIGHQTAVRSGEDWAGEESIEAVTEVSARIVYDETHTKPGSQVYSTEVARYRDLSDTHPEEVRFAQIAGFIGMQSQGEVDRMIGFNKLFDRT